MEHIIQYINERLRYWGTEKHNWMLEIDNERKKEYPDEEHITYCENEINWCGDVLKDLRHIKNMLLVYYDDQKSD